MTFIDLFAGIGGFRLGMEQAGHKCLGHCEWDRFANYSYAAMHLLSNDEIERLKNIKVPFKKNGLPNFKQRQKYIREVIKKDEWFASDIRTVRAADIPNADCWCFGFPCQDISVAGKQPGFRGERSSLFYTVTGLIKQLQEKDKPSYLFIENVKNLLSVNKGWDFTAALVELDEIGYDAEWCVVNSADVIAQNRERIFIIGHFRGRCTSKVFPIEGTGREIATADVKQLGNFMPTKTRSNPNQGRIYATDGIAPCISKMDGGGRQPYVAIPVLTPDRAEKRQNGRRFKENGEPMFTLTSQDKHGVLITQNEIQCTTEIANTLLAAGPSRGRGNKNTITGVMYQLGRGKNKGGFKDISPTLTKNAFEQNNFVFDGIAIRRLTPRECFRLQTFPDELFDKAALVNSDSQLYKQAGNSVTVEVIHRIAERMRIELCNIK